MKPLLVIPPAPARWPALHALIETLSPAELHDLEARWRQSVPGAQDAFAVMPEGGQVLAAAGICRSGEFGVLRNVVTRPTHRKRGLARQLIGAVVSWFQMIGGRRLYLTCPAELIEFFARFEFYETNVAVQDGRNVAVMRRVFPGASDDPLGGEAEVAVRDVTRADWPAMVALLQHTPGADPRIPLPESAVLAQASTLELLEQQDRGVCALKGAFRGAALIGFGSLATDQLGERTYAMRVPHAGAPGALREALITLATAKGYAKVDFPLEAHPPLDAPLETATT